MKQTRSVSMMYVEDDVRKRFSDAEMILLQDLVNQEFSAGVVTERGLRNLYSDIFPMVMPPKFMLMSIAFKAFRFLSKTKQI